MCAHPRPTAVDPVTASVSGIKPDYYMKIGDECKVTGSKGDTYRITRRVDHYVCTCLHWTFQCLPLMAKSCKHLKALLGQSYEQQRIHVGAMIAAERPTSRPKGYYSEDELVYVTAGLCATPPPSPSKSEDSKASPSSSVERLRSKRGKFDNDDEGQPSPSPSPSKKAKVASPKKENVKKKHAKVAAQAASSSAQKRKNAKVKKEDADGSAATTSRPVKEEK